MPQTLVAVAAHADDAELNAGGTLAKRAAEGWRIHIVMMTANTSGLMIPEGGPEEAKRRLAPAETREIRRREQEAAARLIGAAVHNLDYPQRRYWDESRGAAVEIGFAPGSPAPAAVLERPPLLAAFERADEVERLATLLSDLKPDIVLTQTPVDLDPEHHATASMVWRAMNKRRERFGKAALQFWSPGDSCYDGMFAPGADVVEDVSAWFVKKIEMCAAHASQWTRFR
ncbi:MAG: PIG-L family deacetylase, partial [Planctomycetota bacterium]